MRLDQMLLLMFLVFASRLEMQLYLRAAVMH